MKNILFMIPSLEGGGAEKVLVTLLNSLDSQKFDVTLFSLFDEGVNKQYLNENITYKYYWKNKFRGNTHYLKLFSPTFLYKKIIKEEYDIAISYLEGPTTRIVSGCNYNETKLINWVHAEYETSEQLVSSYRNLQEMIDTYNNYDKTIFVAKSVERSFEELLPLIDTPKGVKYNSVDNNFINELSKEEIKKNIYDANKINLISVGRFIEVKGYVRLINVIDQLVREGFDMLHLYLLGKGNLEKKYRSLIKEYNLENYITILGYQDNPYKYLKKSDLFVCSSYTEGFSTAVTESLIVGTPVITTATSGMEELLGSNNEYGVITENSEEALYTGIKQLLSSPDLIRYYKKKAEERSANFELTETVSEIEKLLENI